MPDRRRPAGGGSTSLARAQAFGEDEQVVVPGESVVTASKSPPAGRCARPRLGCRPGLRGDGRPEVL